ncbi:hypothetical protein MKZ38_001980 [Zalerion maritima]|uniref:Protein transport protein sec73 n=1 Tax=Zalerion maritima TaxID=339359 RepID=A0AAD5WTF8_9PEZI|nr:hypothetical protein MKZ38_001980 [Zalerion maritima]
MPFLRRRGVMASETDIRRRTLTEETGLQDPTCANSTTNSFLPTASSSTAPSTPHTQHATATPSSSSSSNPNSHGLQNDHANITPKARVVSAASSVPGSETPTGSRNSTADIPQIIQPPSPPIQEETPKHRRFSMLRFRNASDSQLSTRAKQQAQAEKPPPLPKPPEIITTAPTGDFAGQQPQKKPSRLKLTSRIRRSSDLPSDSSSLRKTRKEGRKSISDLAYSSTSLSFDEPPPIPESSELTLPRKQSESLGPRRARLSESSASSMGEGPFSINGTSGNHVTGGRGTPVFFRLPRRRPKQPEPLFALSHLPQKSKAEPLADPRGSSSSLAVPSTISENPGQGGGSNDRCDTPGASHRSSGNDGNPSTTQSPSIVFSSRSNASPATALFRPGSVHSAQSSPTRARLTFRGRSSTMSSAGGRDSIDEHLSPPTGRSSISTGRKSFGDLLGLNRFRQNSDQLSLRQGAITPLTPGSNTSKNNSLQLPRGSVSLPEKQEDDTPARYLVKVEEVINRSLIASALSKGNDPFHQAVLRSYMRRFIFFGDPMDMAIRKLLMEAELPKETQQIDRCLQSFANRYHECNPGIYSSPDQAYFIAFSLLILHTDVFNKNNKYKMQKGDYLKNTAGEGIFDDILECFYDNITYTPFIHVEDELEMNGERIVSHKGKKKSIFPTPVLDEGKKVYKEPIDPYAVILDKKLDVLRPSLKDVMELEEHYSYLGSAQTLNLGDLQKTFFRTGVLQIISARSRPDAFMTEKTANNPEAAHPGIVDIKITKVGVLWRKETKKKKTRSPWQEWGAILTGAQLYFFRNVGWVKTLIHQYENHLKQGNDGIPCIFKPPLEQFKPDGLISTDGAVALVDATYKKHKHAFVYVRPGGLEEVLLADNEEEMNDWLAKLNYAAAFRTSGVRMRGVVGGHYEGQSRRGFRRLDSSDGTQSVQTPTGEVTIARGRIDHKMAQDILSARRDIMREKIDEANEKLEASEKELSYQLRNARHIQILAPIQQKTREQVLLSAGRMAAHLKRSRTEIWRIKCHRDILHMDLEEERKLSGLPPAEPPNPSSPVMDDKPALTPIDTQSGASTQGTSKSPKSPRPRQVSRTSTLENRDAVDSPSTEVFQTPPTSAKAGGGFHKHQPSLELSPGAYIDPSRLRNNSVSSIASSVTGQFATPPCTAVPPKTPAKDQNSKKRERGDSDDVDAGERNLLEQAGLLSHSSEQNADGRSVNGDGEDGQSRRERPGSASTDKADKGKIRRSLHRTVREGVGHLSHHHHRGRRGRDSVSSGTAQDEATREEMLVRGSGSFVVHGKKASVINFGTELQSISPEGRLRPRRSYRENLAGVAASSSANGDSGAAEEDDDLQAVVWDPLSQESRPRRESAASASTATARSFRELHRKYSSAQASKSIAGGLVVPSDDDSDAAISFSEGRRTPLPPIEGDTELETKAEKESARVLAKEEEGGFPQPTIEDDAESRAQFFTPEEPSTPVDVESEHHTRLAIQTVTA